MKKNKNGNIKNIEEVTNGYFNVPIEGNSEADEVWSLLFSRNMENLKDRAHSLFLKGLKELNMNDLSIPNLKELHDKIYLKTGWTLTPTDDEYSDFETWFDNLGKKLFLVTKVIRSKENLDYTPFPEAFHDIFGHLSFLCNDQYARIVHKFGLKYNSILEQEEKQKFANFWWYVIEFGLMKENGEIKAFGAGLMSSFGECNNAFSQNVIIKEFDPEEMKNTPISDHNFHQKLFVIDSLDQVEKIIDQWN